MTGDEEFIPEEEQTEDDEDPVAGFYEGWQDVMNGNTYPIFMLWDDLDEE